MNITDKILSIPPYISSSWKNITSLHMETRPFGQVLVIELSTGTKIDIPNLDGPTLEQIFACHAKTVEEDAFPMPFAFPNLKGLMSITQHVAEQKESAPLPPEMLEKIAEMTKGLLPDDLSCIQPPESGCNCPHCQIMRAIVGPAAEPAAVEEAVSDEDLKFRTWDIKQENDKLYSVMNPLDHKEHYNVFLGDPIGCSCGNNNCEHIQAVLKS
jgi:hypothetical protein